MSRGRTSCSAKYSNTRNSRKKSYTKDPKPIWTTNTDFSYSDMSLIITETKDDFIWEKTFISKVNFSIEYVLKLEIKDYKVRATIMPSRFLYFDNYYNFKEYWPFTNKLKKNMQKRILYQLVDYTDVLFDHIENGIAENITATDENW